VQVVERILSLAESPVIVIASARPESISRLGARLLEQVSLRIDLAAWSEAETNDYLRDSVAQAGRPTPAFAPAAARRLFELSGGAPRKLNQLAQLALVAGAAQRLGLIDAATIDAVQEELSLAR
jgi:general secretion pathway protein A